MSPPAAEWGNAMEAAVQRLTNLVQAGDRYAIPYADLRAAQIAAADARFQDRKRKIKLLAHRAQEASLAAVTGLPDLVPLLFAHTAYKSYPETWLAERKWDRMGKWLETISTHKVENVATAGIAGIDDWIERLGEAGHFVSCTSGTSGKSAMLNASQADMDWTEVETVASFSWGSGVIPAQDRVMFGVTAVASVPKNLCVRAALQGAFGDPQAEIFNYPVPPITIGQITGMVALRKAIAEGTAKPADIARYEEISAARQAAMDNAIGITAQALIDARKRKLFLTGMWASLYKIAEAVRAAGYGGADFHPENALYAGGGLKGAVLPGNYREYIFETFALTRARSYQMYGMQEINSSMPRCPAGRYHIPPWVIALVLDQDGEKLLPASGEVEGRAAFFDLALDGRWGGVISGDKIQLDYGKCACGNHGPSIRDNIARFADLPGGDKISCSGTIDAYVRGVA